MSIVPWVMQDFEDGWSTDLKSGGKNSQAFTQSIDFRKSPSQISVLPQPTREDNNIVTDLIQNEVMVSDGSIYALGSAGNFYKRTTSGAWSLEGGLPAGYFGMDYRQDLDSIYLCHAKTVSLFNPVSTNPILSPNYYNISQSTYNNTTNAGFNVSTSQQGSTLTTTIMTTFAEDTQTQERFFQTDIEPLNKISIYIPAKGSGDWTLTLHDGLNNKLGSVTITNANLVNNQFNDFIFSSPIRVSVAPAARTYHIHITSTVADGTVSSTATNDLSTCDLQIWADRLIQTTNGMHPMANFLQYECIGNERYLSVWEPLGDPSPDNSEWQRHKLIFPPYYQVCGLAVLNEYIAIACERIPTGNSTAQDGIIFWWDGLASTYNYFTKIPEGSPYGIQESKNIVYYYAGGDWYAIAGANSVPVKIWSFPNSQTEYSDTVDKTIIYPYTSTIRRGILLQAYPSTTTNKSIQYGVYSYGQVNKNYPQSFGYNYLLSTGSQLNTGSNNLTIGMVKNFGDVLHTSWQDGNKFGIDVTDNFSNPATYSTWESLIFDAGYVGKLKNANYMETSYLSLPSDSYFQLKYNINRTGWIIDSNKYSSINLWQGRHKYARFNVTQEIINGAITENSGQFYEIQLGIDIYCPTGVTQPPTFTMFALIFDNQKENLLQ